MAIAVNSIRVTDAPFVSRCNEGTGSHGPSNNPVTVTVFLTGTHSYNSAGSHTASPRTVPAAVTVLAATVGMAKSLEKETTKNKEKSLSDCPPSICVRSPVTNTRTPGPRRGAPSNHSVTHSKEEPGTIGGMGIHPVTSLTGPPSSRP